MKNNIKNILKIGLLMLVITACGIHNGKNSNNIYESYSETQSSDDYEFKEDRSETESDILMHYSENFKNKRNLSFNLILQNSERKFLKSNIINKYLNPGDLLNINSKEFNDLFTEIKRFCGDDLENFMLPKLYATLNPRATLTKHEFFNLINTKFNALDKQDNVLSIPIYIMKQNKSIDLQMRRANNRLFKSVKLDYIIIDNQVKFNKSAIETLGLLYSSKNIKDFEFWDDTENKWKNIKGITGYIKKNIKKNPNINRLVLQTRLKKSNEYKNFHLKIEDENRIILNTTIQYKKNTQYNSSKTDMIFSNQSKKLLDDLCNNKLFIDNYVFEWNDRESEPINFTRKAVYAYIKHNILNLRESKFIYIKLFNKRVDKDEYKRINLNIVDHTNLTPIKSFPVYYTIRSGKIYLHALSEIKLNMFDKEYYDRRYVFRNFLVGEWQNVYKKSIKEHIEKAILQNTNLQNLDLQICEKVSYLNNTKG